MNYSRPTLVFIALILATLIAADETPTIPQTPPKKPRTDIQISGVYPHLTTYGVYSQNGAHYKKGHNECGIGAIVPWAGKLYMVNYAPHMPHGSEHKLFSISPDLKTMTVHPESVGGTPAGRMIHKESNQLLIAHYLIDSKGAVRTISPRDMPMRVTAIARHLKDPANMVYYIDMEGAIWEANVHTLKAKMLFKKPVPGWHGKGGYTSQGRLVVSNNGELAVGSYEDVLVGGAARNQDEAGVLAEYNGKNWKIIERRQFTDITGPGGITPEDDAKRLWAIGWDRRSLRLKLLEDGDWKTYLLPKASHCNDARHGWYTEWPRIREITKGRWMMDMHGMFFDFPPTFSSANTAGIRPIGSHLRYVPDFCDWNGKLVLASDETSIQENDLAGQPQSNLWFGDYEELKEWGPASGFGGPWIEDEVAANTPSDPFLVAGFDRRVLFLSNDLLPPKPTSLGRRAADQQAIHKLPKLLSPLTRVMRNRGDWRKPAPGFTFRVNQPVTIYLAVDRRGAPKLADGWKKTDFEILWGENHQDFVYSRTFEAGDISIPPNETEHKSQSFGMPHTAFVLASDADTLSVKSLGAASVVQPPKNKTKIQPARKSVKFTLEHDTTGDGKWTTYDTVTLAPGAFMAYVFPDDYETVWLRLKADRDCIATAYLHQTTAQFADGSTKENQALFAGLADIGDEEPLGGLVYAAKRNRNLRVAADADRHFEFTKSDFTFEEAKTDAELNERLRIKPQWSVDEASVVVHQGKRKLRLPKGNAAFDKPLPHGWPRDIREVESERLLANIHGTFYEVPLVTNGAPPALNHIRPIASHSKQIADFCSWNGLLVLSGLKQDAQPGNHVFINYDHNVGLWFGGIDDLWKLGKPVGRGGPWKNTNVKAGVASDPYLMTGYDRKSLTLSHELASSATIHIEVDITGDGHWRRYRSLQVAPKKSTRFDFPPEFSAHWVRLVCDEDAVATGQLIYD